MASINENAFYILVDKTLIDCNDIERMVLIGYEPITGTNSPNLDRPFYRIIFNDGSYIEGRVDKNGLERYNNFKKGDDSFNASE